MFILFFAIFVPSLAQNIAVCSTATWNSTARVIAGTTSSYGSTSTKLYNPMDVSFDANGTFYVADYSNDRIQRFPSGSITGTTVSGLSVSSPTGVVVKNNSVLYIIDYLNYRIQKWDNGVVTTVAGGHGSGSTVDKMSTTYAIYIDNNSNIYVSEYGNHRVSLWTAGNTTAGRLVRSFVVGKMTSPTTALFYLGSW